MPYIYVSCAGDSRANGLYDLLQAGTFTQMGGSSTIEYNYQTSKWELIVTIGGTPTVLYRLLSPGSGGDTNAISKYYWVRVGTAALPVPKTFDFNPAGIPTIRVSLASDIPNGNYTWNPNITYSSGHSIWPNGLSGAFVSDSDSSYIIGKYSFDTWRIANASTSLYTSADYFGMPLDELWSKLSPAGPSVVTTSLPGSTITLSGAGTAGINGTYTWNSHILVNYSTNSSTYSMGYLHSDGTYVIAVDGTQTWSVLDVANGSKYYSSTISYDQIPTGSFTHDGFFELGTQPAPTASYSSANLCLVGTPPGGTTGGGGVTETTPFLTGKYIYTKDNVNYVRSYNNQPYIR